MVKVGTLPKNVENFVESIVADVTISLRSERRATTWEQAKLHKDNDLEHEVKWIIELLCLDFTENKFTLQKLSKFLTFALYYDVTQSSSFVFVRFQG